MAIDDHNCESLCNTCNKGFGRSHLLRVLTRCARAALNSQLACNLRSRFRISITVFLAVCAVKLSLAACNLLFFITVTVELCLMGVESVDDELETGL